MGDLLRRRLGLVVAGVIVLVLLSANRISTFLTDLWWFDALGYQNVFTELFLTKLGLGAVFGLVLAVLVAGNLVVARRLRPFFLPSTPQQANVERYRQMADPYLPWIIGGVALLFGLTSGFAVAAQWEPFLLWANAQPFGIEDPQFGRDVSYYVFSLPWLKFVQTWLFTSLVLVTLLTAGAHYLLGGIRPEASGEKVLPSVKVHLSVLLALVLAIRGWGYWLDRFMLNFSPRGQVTGASYTDVNAELPGLNLLLVVTAVAIGLVLFNIRRRGWLLPGAAIGLLVLASIVLQGAYPAAIQRLRVDPQELPQEREFIERNLEATRRAYGLEDIELQAFNIENDLDEADVEENRVTLENIRLWDPVTLASTYAELQALRPYYRFNDVDVDRYMIDGELRQVTLASRELQLLQGLESGAQTWQNLHLTFTHGFGVAASRVNTSNPEGQPVFLARDIPPRGQEELVPNQPGIYYGEVGNPDYSIVGSQEAPELDYENPETNQQVTTNYAGDGGVQAGNLLRRLAFALRFSDPNLLLSNLIDSDSKILFQRDIKERVRTVAPFLELDRDPYPVVTDDRILWVQDAYTTSDFYPYSERRILTTDRQTRVNYARNSVKAVVDAFHGTVDLFVVDPDDPVVQAWAQVFPEPFKAMDELPEGLEAHFRYPEDLFTLQSDLYTTYHIPGAAAFYSKADEWDIPRDAAALQNNQQLSPATTLLRPYYLLMRLPGETDEEFVLIQPYLPNEKPNMVAWLAGRSDPENYGELFGVQFPTDAQVLGPSQAQARIEQESNVSQYITLRDRSGSKVVRGNLLVLPVAESILYVEPLFLENEQARIPELDRVVMVMGERVVMEETLEGALAAVVGAEPPSDDQEQPDEGAPDEDGEQDPQAEQLLLQALQRFREADQALREGNLGRYQDLVEEGRRLLEAAAEAQGLSPGEAQVPSPIPDSAESPEEFGTEGELPPATDEGDEPQPGEQ